MKAQQELFSLRDSGDNIRNFLFRQTSTILQLFKIVVYFSYSCAAVPVDNVISVYVNDPGISPPVKAVYF